MKSIKNTNKADFTSIIHLSPTFKTYFMNQVSIIMHSAMQAGLYSYKSMLNTTGSLIDVVRRFRNSL